MEYEEYDSDDANSVLAAMRAEVTAHNKVIVFGTANPKLLRPDRTFLRDAMRIMGGTTITAKYGDDLSDEQRDLGLADAFDGLQDGDVVRVAQEAVTEWILTRSTLTYHNHPLFMTTKTVKPAARKWAFASNSDIWPITTQDRVRLLAYAASPHKYAAPLNEIHGLAGIEYWELHVRGPVAASAKLRFGVAPPEWPCDGQTVMKVDNIPFVCCAVESTGNWPVVNLIAQQDTGPVATLIHDIAREATALNPSVAKTLNPNSGSGFRTVRDLVTLYTQHGRARLTARLAAADINIVGPLRVDILELKIMDHIRKSTFIKGTRLASCKWDNMKYAWNSVDDNPGPLSDSGLAEFVKWMAPPPGAQKADHDHRYMLKVPYSTKTLGMLLVHGYGPGTLTVYADGKIYKQHNNITCKSRLVPCVSVRGAQGATITISCPDPILPLQTRLTNTDIRDILCVRLTDFKEDDAPVNLLWWRGRVLRDAIHLQKGDLWANRLAAFRKQWGSVAENVHRELGQNDLDRLDEGGRIYAFMSPVIFGLAHAPTSAVPAAFNKLVEKIKLVDTITKDSNPDDMPQVPHGDTLRGFHNAVMIQDEILQTLEPYMKRMCKNTEYVYSHDYRIGISKELVHGPHVMTLQEIVEDVERGVAQHNVMVPNVTADEALLFWDGHTCHPVMPECSGGSRLLPLRPCTFACYFSFAVTADEATIDKHVQTICNTLMHLKDTKDAKVIKPLTRNYVGDWNNVNYFRDVLHALQQSRSRDAAPMTEGSDDDDDGETGYQFTAMEETLSSKHNLTRATFKTRLYAEIAKDATLAAANKTRIVEAIESAITAPFANSDQYRRSVCIGSPVRIFNRRHADKDIPIESILSVLCRDEAEKEGYLNADIAIMKRHCIYTLGKWVATCHSSSERKNPEWRALHLYDRVVDVGCNTHFGDGGDTIKLGDELRLFDIGARWALQQHNIKRAISKDVNTLFDLSDLGRTWKPAVDPQPGYYVAATGALAHQRAPTVSRVLVPIYTPDHAFFGIVTLKHYAMHTIRESFDVVDNNYYNRMSVQRHVRECAALWDDVCETGISPTQPGFKYFRATGLKKLQDVGYVGNPTERVAGGECWNHMILLMMILVSNGWETGARFAGYCNYPSRNKTQAFYALYRYLFHYLLKLEAAIFEVMHNAELTLHNYWIDLAELEVDPNVYRAYVNADTGAHFASCIKSLLRKTKELPWNDGDDRPSMDAQLKELERAMQMREQISRKLPSMRCAGADALIERLCVHDPPLGLADAVTLLIALFAPKKRLDAAAVAALRTLYGWDELCSRRPDGGDQPFTIGNIVNACIFQVSPLLLKSEALPVDAPCTYALSTLLDAACLQIADAPVDSPYTFVAKTTSGRTTLVYGSDMEKFVRDGLSLDRCRSDTDCTTRAIKRAVDASTDIYYFDEAVSAENCTLMFSRTAPKAGQHVWRYQTHMRHQIPSFLLSVLEQNSAGTLAIDQTGGGKRRKKESGDTSEQLLSLPIEEFIERILDKTAYYETKRDTTCKTLRDNKIIITAQLFDRYLGLGSAFRGVLSGTSDFDATLDEWGIDPIVIVRCRLAFEDL
tara:strand:+ start:14 stop:4765 length:4752 start_codon:yes stop_codon:yes gene_type:complete